jgi:hypothetical protein
MATEKEQELKNDFTNMLLSYDDNLIACDISIEYGKEFETQTHDGYKAILVMDYIYYSDLAKLEQNWHISKIEGVGEALKILLYHKKAIK